MKIVDKKLKEPDTLEELVEAMKLFDNDKDGKLLVPELRWAMNRLGEQLDEGLVDEMVKEIDTQQNGYIDIWEFAKTCFNIKEKKEEKVDPKKDAKKDPKKKKWTLILIFMKFNFLLG